MIGSTLAGWPPARYRAARVNFIVRRMTALHHREAVYGEPLQGRTWAQKIRRGMFFHRECRIVAPEGPVAAASQQWVHIGEGLTLTRADDALISAFPTHEHEPSVTFPDVTPIADGVVHAFTLRCWDTWMDPLGHVNHPVYVDWCDEGTSRALRAHGGDPVLLVPVAEELMFREGIEAGDAVRVETQLVGRTEDSIAFHHRVLRGEDGALAAEGRTLRRLAAPHDDATALLALAAAAPC